VEVWSPLCPHETNGEADSLGRGDRIAAIQGDLGGEFTGLEFAFGRPHVGEGHQGPHAGAGIAESCGELNRTVEVGVGAWKVALEVLEGSQAEESTGEVPMEFVATGLDHPVEPDAALRRISPAEPEPGESAGDAECVVAPAARQRRPHDASHGTRHEFGLLEPRWRRPSSPHRWT